MADPLDASRLPDLPIAGYSTQREKETTDAIMFFMRGVERDRILLLSIVIDGKGKFRHLAMKQWRGLAIDHDLVDSVWEYFKLQAGEYPIQQRDRLLRMQESPLAKYGLVDVSV